MISDIDLELKRLKKKEEIDEEIDVELENIKNLDENEDF